MVRSITRQGSASSRLRCWVAVNSPSKMTRSTSCASHIWRSSSSRPAPSAVALSGDSRFCTSSPTTSPPAVSVSSVSSSSELCISNAPVSMDTKMTRSVCFSCSIISMPSLLLVLVYHTIEQNPAHSSRLGRRILRGAEKLFSFSTKSGIIAHNYILPITENKKGSL